METEKRMSTEKMPFEAAMDRVGFGLYGILLTCWTGVAIISFVCIGYAATIIVPTSACELATTGSQQGMLAAGPVVGSMLGGILWGYLADTRGRRSMLLVALTAAAIVNALSSISVNWIMLLIMNFVAALCASGLYPMSMSLLSESVPLARRNIVVLLVSSIFLLAQGIMAVLAIPVIPLRFSYELPSLGIYFNSWRFLLIVYSMPSVVTGIFLIFLQESPKYAYTKGDEDKALHILRAIHRVNNLGSKEELEVKSLVKEEHPVSQTTGASKGQIAPLFKPPLLKYTIIMTTLMMIQVVGSFQVWLPTIADKFIDITQTGEGTDLNMCAILDLDLDLPVDPDAVPCALNETSLLMVLAVGALQSIFNIITSTMVNSVGRRNIVMGVTALCGLSGILVNLVPSAVGSAALFAVMLLGIVMIGYYTALTVSLFPTHLRALAIAIVVSGSRLSTFACIQILNLMLANNCDAGFYLFACIFASSAIVASFLPDDRRRAPPPPQIKEDMSQNVDQPQTRDITE